MQLTIAALASPANSPPIGSFLPATWIRLKFRSVSSRRAYSGGHKSGEWNSTEPIGLHLFASPGADFGWILRRSLVSIVTAKIRAQVTDMNTWLCKTLLWIAVAGCCAPLRVRNTVAATYNLAEVRGMEGFQGATNGLDLLRSNGFVVTDPTFKQIFEAYIQSPQIEPPSETNRFGQSLPAFITTDSAWHTYHILLEEGVKEMELVQAQRLFRGEIKFGDVTQTASAFGSIQDGLSFFRNSYDSFAGWRASIIRLHGLVVANEQGRALPEVDVEPSAASLVELDDVEVRTPDGRQLINELQCGGSKIAHPVGAR